MTSTVREFPDLRDRYAELESLGAGGQAEVYRGRDRHSGDTVVIKELDLTSVENWKAIELFERETEVLEQLDHPSIPNFVDAFELDNRDSGGTRFFLVQEFVEGTDFKELLEQGFRFDDAQARRFLDEMLQILRYLHSADPQVIHRDIKPSNIIRRPDGDLALIDFGAVQAVAPGGGDDTVVGTTGYMPMEQLMGRAVEATDLYGLAATAVHLLSHRHPDELPVDNRALQFHDVINVSPSLTALLDQMLKPHVEDRLATADEALQRLRSGGSEATRPQPVDIEFGRPARPSPSGSSNVASTVRDVLDSIAQGSSQEFETVKRPVDMRSTLESDGNRLRLVVPQPPNVVLSVLYVGLFAVMALGAPVGIIAASLISGESPPFCFSMIFGIAMGVGAVLVYRGRFQKTAIDLDADTMTIRRQWPHGQKVESTPVDNIASIQITTERRSGGSRKRRFNPKKKVGIFWDREQKAQTLGFLRDRKLTVLGKHMSEHEVKYLIQELNRFIGHPLTGKQQGVADDDLD